MNTMGKKFLSVILSALMFVCPFSTFAAGSSQFEEVCNFYDYANQELINSNSDHFIISAGENFEKYYNRASEYIIEHADDFDPESGIGKMAQLTKYIKADHSNMMITVDGISDVGKPIDLFHGYFSNLIAIRETLFLKQTLAYLKEKNTDVFGTDNVEELSRLGDAVAYLEENLSEIIYSAEESLIEYIKSLPLSDTVKEDMEREILRTQVVDFAFLRSYDYLFDGFSLKDVTLFDKTLSMEENFKVLGEINDELEKKCKLPREVALAAMNSCTTNAFNTWDLSEWGEEAKYMDTRENFIILHMPLILPFTLNGQDLESDIINFSESLGHEFGHLVQCYSPCNIDYAGDKYSISDISASYRNCGFYNESYHADWCNYGGEGTYEKAFKQSLNSQKKSNQKYVSLLQAEDIAYFDDLRNRIKSHFESMPLEDMGYSETERMNGDAIYNEVFSDIYGLNTAMNYMRRCGNTNFEKLFSTHSQFFYETSFEKQEPNEQKRQKLRIDRLYKERICSYPVHGLARVNGVLTMIPEYVQWAKTKARAYHPEFSATDKNTGVQIQADMGKLVDGVSLIVSKLNKDSDAYNTTFSNVDDHIKDQIENINIYSVSVIDRNGNTVQPEAGVGAVKLRIPIPQDFDKADLSALYIAYGNYGDESNKGNIVNLNGTDYYEFEVQHFSDYALVDQLTTYEKMFWPIVLISVIVLAVITISIVLYNKKKKASHSSK